MDCRTVQEPHDPPDPDTGLHTNLFQAGGGQGCTRKSHFLFFFGVQSARMLRGVPSIRDTWSTRETLFAIGMASESMPRGAFGNTNCCFHFADDWDEPEDEKWEDIS